MEPNDNVEESIIGLSKQLERKLHHESYCRTDRLFAWLMVIQWIGGIITAIFVSPYTWIGEQSLVHTHVMYAIVFGGLISSAPIALAIMYPGRAITRHVIAVSQALWGTLLIHLSGGRLETHFHVFCSLAFIAFYRDWTVLLTMTLFVAVDHAIRGVYFPLSVYGVVFESPFRWIEHAAWVVAEDFVLVLACRRSREESRALCENQAKLQQSNHQIERIVSQRTRELKEKTVEAEQLALVARHTDNSVVITGPDSRIEWINEGFTRITGYSKSEVIGQVPIDVLRGPTTKDSEVEQLFEQLATREPFHIVVHKHRKSGEQIIMSIEVRPIFNQDGKLIRYFQIERDITTMVNERDHLEKLTQELKHSSMELEKLSLVAKYTDNSVVITDADFRVEWVNDGFTRMTGYGLDEVQGRVPDHFIQNPGNENERYEKIADAIREQKGFNVELVSQHKDGSTYWVDIEVRAIRNGQGVVSNFVAIEKDITKRKLNEKEREQLASELHKAARQAGMAELASDVLHNVGNALNSINVSTQLLREMIESKTPGHLARLADLINENRTSLADFVIADPRGKKFPEFLNTLATTISTETDAKRDEVISLSEKVDHVKEIVANQKMFSHQRSPSEPVDVSKLFEDAINMNRASLANHRIEIVRDFTSLPEFLIEKHAVLQILINLVKNAKESVVEAQQSSPMVKVSTTNVNGELHFIVQDNGVGIAPDKMSSIFQHGFTTKATGHGFGLHASANTAQELGGALIAESDGVGMGATFILQLPVELPPCELSVNPEIDWGVCNSIQTRTSP